MKRTAPKKILVLGGTRHIIGLVKSIKLSGMSPIVVDNIVNSPAKFHADKSFNANLGDTDRLMEIIRCEKVEGIFTAFEDINTWNAVALCKKADLPFYMTQEQLGVMSNRDKFMEICKRFNIALIPDNALENPLEEASKMSWNFPVLIKSKKAG